METFLIEQFDKSMYSLIKWLTVGWTIWYGTFIAKNLITNKLIVWLLMIVGFIGWIMFLVNLTKYTRLGKKINSDSKLKEALNNEMHQLYKYKSAFWGFCISIAANSIFLVILFFHQISAVLVCELTLFFGILSSLIAVLVYNRD
jgi:hypothetical protein